MENITNNEVYEQVLADSFGGVMYDVANRGKYDAAALLTAWDNLSASERESAGGITKGAISFLKGDN